MQTVVESKSNDDAILEQLNKIRELLTPKPVPPAPQGMKNEFITFLAQYKVLGLAVAFIMGLYLGNVVKALVTDLILPIVAFALPPGTNINTYMVGPFGIGDFANNVITFAIVAFVIFLIVKVATKAGLNQ
jgi:large conductance mechanosensitive channel